MRQIVHAGADINQPHHDAGLHEDGGPIGKSQLKDPQQIAIGNASPWDQLWFESARDIAAAVVNTNGNPL